MVSTSTSTFSIPALYTSDDWRFELPLRRADNSDMDLNHAELWLFLKDVAGADTPSYTIKVSWDTYSDEVEGVFRVKVPHTVTKTIAPGNYYLEAKRLYRAEADDSILDIATLIYDTKNPSITVLQGVDIPSLTE